MKKKLIKLSIFFGLFVCVFSTYAHAKEENPSYDKVGYSVEAILPENQVNSLVTYFDIEMSQKQEQTLRLKIYNHTNEEIKILGGINFAATNENGILVYDGSVSEYDESMKYPFNRIAELNQKEYTIKSKGQSIVEINVKAPSEKFDGEILGGIYLKRVFEKKKNNKQNSIGIENEYAYAVAIRIKEKDNNEEVKGNIELKEVFPSLIHHRTGLQTEFRNTTPTLISKLNFIGEVYREGSDRPLYRRSVEQFSVAPNSKFNFPISFENKPLKEGNYIFKGSAKNEKYDFKFERKFTISKIEQEDINEKAVELEKENNFLLYILMMMIFVLLGIIIFILLKNKKNKKEDN